LYGLFHRLEEATAQVGPGDGALAQLLEQFRIAFPEAMSDDFNTPAALALFQRLRGDLNRLLGEGLSKRACQEAREVYRGFGQILGLFQLPVRDWEFKELQFRLQENGHQAGTDQKGRPTSEPSLSDEDIERLLAERRDARNRKDFARADEIRKYLAERGIISEDRPDGISRWKRA
jgi:cysteinyl-tRNA synthetase